MKKFVRLWWIFVVLLVISCLLNWSRLFEIVFHDAISSIISVLFVFLFVWHVRNFLFIRKEFADVWSATEKEKRGEFNVDGKFENMSGELKNYFDDLQKASKKAFSNGGRVEVDQKDFKTHLQTKLIYSKESLIAIGSNVLISLGLIGTVWGLIGAISSLEGVISNVGDNTGEMLEELKITFKGMSTAFYTTFLGAVLGGVVLKLLQGIYRNIAVETINGITRLAAIQLLPVLNQKRSEDTLLTETLENIVQKFNNDLVSQFGDNFKRLDEACLKLLDWQANYKNIIEKSQASHQNFIEQSQENYQNISEKSQTYFDEISEKLNSFVDQAKSFSDISKNLEKRLGKLNDGNEKAEAVLKSFFSLTKQTEDNIKKIRDNVLTFVNDFLRDAEDHIMKKSHDAYTRSLGALKDNMEKTVHGFADNFGPIAQKFIEQYSLVYSDNHQQMNSITDANTKLLTKYEKQLVKFNKILDGIKKQNTITATVNKKQK